MPRSLFSGSTRTSRSLFSNTDYKALLQMYTNLFKSNIYKEIMSLNTLFIEGNTNQLQEKLTLDNYQKLSNSLFSMAFPTSPEYEVARQILGKILENLYQSTLQYALLQNTQSNLESCNEKASNLNNVKSILAYLEKLRKSNFLFNSTLTSTAAKLKPEYAKYVSLYGIPPGGVFETDKLAAIVAELKRPT